MEFVGMCVVYLDFQFEIPRFTISNNRCHTKSEILLTTILLSYILRKYNCSKRFMFIFPNMVSGPCIRHISVYPVLQVRACPKM